MNDELQQMELPQKMLSLAFDLIEGFPDKLDHEIPESIQYRDGFNYNGTPQEVYTSKNCIMREVYKLFGDPYMEYVEAIETHMNKRVEVALEKEL